MQCARTAAAGACLLPPSRRPPLPPPARTDALPLVVPATLQDEIEKHHKARDKLPLDINDDVALSDDSLDEDEVSGRLAKAACRCCRRCCCCRCLWLSGDVAAAQLSMQRSCCLEASFPNPPSTWR